MKAIATKYRLSQLFWDFLTFVAFAALGWLAENATEIDFVRENPLIVGLVAVVIANLRREIRDYRDRQKFRDYEAVDDFDEKPV